MLSNATTRFSNTVENYINYRPGYPTEIVKWMIRQFDLKWNNTIADIGSGTGKLTQLFLDNGNPVFAVEPNQAMREAAENLLQEYPNFNSFNGMAQNTGLPSNYIDFITVGQAFHWFDIPKTISEFKRIGHENTRLFLIWNKRNDAYSDFMEAYNDYLHHYSTDLEKINLRRIGGESFDLTFRDKKYDLKVYDHAQIFDFNGLKGRYLSCSYAFQQGHEHYKEAMTALEKLFDKYQQGGKIEMWYQTEIYYGYI